MRLLVGDGTVGIVTRARSIGHIDALARDRQAAERGFHALHGRCEQLLNRSRLVRTGAHVGGDREQPFEFFGTLRQDRTAYRRRH